MRFIINRLLLYQSPIRCQVLNIWGNKDKKYHYETEKYDNLNEE